MALVRIGSDNIDEIDVKLGNIPLRWKITYPTGEPELVFPENAYFITPDVEGNFTKAMVDSAVALGEEYIVFDAPTLDIHYELSPHLLGGGVRCYIHFTDIIGTELNPITFDFRKVSIDCYHDVNNIFGKHDAFVFESCQNIVLKLGNVEGDKFKREFIDYNEINEDGTGMFVRSGNATKNLVMDGGLMAGFMSDATASTVYGPEHIDGAAPEGGKNYYLQGDGRYESDFFNIDPTLYDGTFGLIGGVGFNRLLFYDMEDVTFKFYDISEVFISEITNAEYYLTYSFPVTARKMKVNVNPMDGRIESPTNFGHNLDYSPNSGTVVKNLKIGDNHRGGIANIGANARIENCEFYNSERYFNDAPEFPQSTKYHLNCEDAVSKNLVVNNNTFNDKFHKILLTHNISADITNNTFGSDGYGISIGYLLDGNITGNTLNGVSCNAGIGTNKSTVLCSGNTGSPTVILTNGAEWKLNNFTNGYINGLGKCNNNTFTNYRHGGLIWNKEVHSNTFIGDGQVPYMYGGAYIYKNTFINKYFVVTNNAGVNPIYFDGVTIDNTETTSQLAFEREYGSNTIIFVNSTFKNARIKNTANNGFWYFEDCVFNDVSDYILNIGAQPSTIFYFKNCQFNGTGTFVSGGSGYEVIFEDCTVTGITMPANHSIVTTGTITTPPLVVPRTQIIPTLSNNIDHVIIRVEDADSDQAYHIINLKIRDKTTKELVFDEDVNGTYTYYTDTPEDFEYCIDNDTDGSIEGDIDGGGYWDSINA